MQHLISTRSMRAWLCFLVLGGAVSRPVWGAELTSRAVLESIDRAKRALTALQQQDGSWRLNASKQYVVGPTSLAMLALLNAGMTSQDEPIARGLRFLRSTERSNATYEVSLMIMTLAAAGVERDRDLLFDLVNQLEKGQITRGGNRGLWDYQTGKGFAGLGGDRSNGQYAVLALRDATYAGIQIEQSTWRNIWEHWLSCQNPDGGWSYSENSAKGESRGSMTVAGIATMVIAESMLDEKELLNRDGTPICCNDDQPNETLERGIRWLENHFSVGNNPGYSSWLMYYLYGLERAGRLSGRRFFGKHDWYREGAKFLVDRQSARDGTWQMAESGNLEREPVISTSFGLLFLSKGLAPVLINKGIYGQRNAGDNKPLTTNWNKHRHDIRNLTQLISGRKDWPKLLSWQEIDLYQVANNGNVGDLLQSPILYLSGEDALQMMDEEARLLRAYIDQGGFIFAVRNCGGAEFERDLRELVSTKLFPEGDADLQPLGAEHPIYRIENLLDPKTVNLEGVEFGCRTVLVYSPDDLSCLWDKWKMFPPKNRPVALSTMIDKAVRIGVNVVAYATGREPPNKLEREAMSLDEEANDPVERGLLQVAQLRHTGGWKTASHALRNLLLALNRAEGPTASLKSPDVPATADLSLYPLVYMHGRDRFSYSAAERGKLREYLERGGMLFADSCCGSPKFDASFRKLMAEMFPGEKLKRIPPDHVIFSEKTKNDLSKVERRVADSGAANRAIEVTDEKSEPFLEGIELNGEFVVIYSKYDISCALERQANAACSGYVEKDAVRIAMNVVLYAMMQDPHYSEHVK